VVLGVLVLGPRIDVVMGALALSMRSRWYCFSQVSSLSGAPPPEAPSPAMADEMRRYAIPLVPIALMNWFHLSE